MTSIQITRRALLSGATAVFFASAARAGGEPMPKVLVSKDPSCACCTAWAEHIRAAGFSVEVSEVKDLARTKARLGVPQDLASCHTAEVGGYVVEGHVPAGALKRLLSERPRASGLAVRGMPIGSPGMEIEGSAPDTYEVVLFGASGRSTFAHYEGARAL